MRGPLAVAAVLVTALVSGRAAQPAQGDVAGAQTVAYCALFEHAQAFEGKMVRVRALYQTDFEQAALTAPACPSPFPLTWVEFEKAWESRSSWRMRHAISGIQWRVQTDVVFVGRFKTAGPFGHMGMYLFEFEVYKVEAVKPAGSFRPLPRGTEKRRQTDASAVPSENQPGTPGNPLR